LARSAYPQAKVLRKRLAEARRLIQVITGPRQSGKTTLVRGGESLGVPERDASADGPALRDRGWVEEHWSAARIEAADAGRGGAVLVLDEVQKVPGWSETVKRLWDEDTRKGAALKVVVLGSAPLLVERGLTGSLAGRFEVLRLPHWSFAEMREAFGLTLEEYVFYGGYPGAAGLIREPGRWARYVADSLIETTMTRDVLLLMRVDKPALLRRLFDLGCRYSGQILSYTKMLGHLQEAGNSITLAHYLDLLAGAGMLVGLQKYGGRGAEPRLYLEAAGAEHGADDGAIEARACRGEGRPGVLGAARGVGGGGAPRQRGRDGRVRAFLLARAQPRGGFRRACRAHGDGHRGEERPPARRARGHGRARHRVQGRAAPARGRRRHPARGVPGETGGALGEGLTVRRAAGLEGESSGCAPKRSLPT
jgi:hypothetical protein